MAEGSEPDQPIVLVDSNGGALGPCHYRIMHPIGTYLKGRFTVYKAIVLYHDEKASRGLTPEDFLVAVKYMDISEESEELLEFITAAAKYAGMSSKDHLVEIQEFTTGVNHCIVMPLMSMGSMRFIRATKFPNGMPEDCILVVLKETLMALQTIHQNNFVHTELHSGNILLNHKGEIRVSFAASVYAATEEQQLPSSESALPFTSICNWAAAPEVYQQRMEATLRCTAKSDVWMIGIIALELARGNIEVSGREELEVTVEEIVKRAAEAKKGKKIDFRLGKSGTSSLLSERFGKMVASCLRTNPSRRPTVTDLLQADIFTGLKMTVSEFYKVVVDKPVMVDVLRL